MKMQFRSALSGFNRSDVVQYIEYLNKQHASQIAQLNSQLQAAQNTDNSALKQQLEEALERCAQLEAELRQERAPSTTEQELEAYRRAERTERLAQERASQIYSQANAVLAEATLKAEEASTGITAVADQLSAQFLVYQTSLQETKDSLQEAVSALYSIRPEE